MSREGFEPSTKGLKVSPGAVHRVFPGAFRSMPRLTVIHGVYPARPESNAVAVNVAVSPRLTDESPGRPGSLAAYGQWLRM